MPEKETAQELELEDGEVGKWASLASLFAHDTDANMGSLDHIDIVSTITDRQSRLVLAMGSNKLD
mgnify:CR=1 FL=1